MKLNEKNTTMICVSAARSYDPKTYVRVGDDVIVSGKKLELSGYHFDSSPTPTAHVKAILKKVHYRT